MKYFAIGKYYKKLYPALRDRYGTSDAYTAGQIKRTVFECGFNKKHLPYAYGLFLAEEGFAEVIAAEFAELSASEIRSYLAKRFFSGNDEFTFTSARFSANVGGGGFDSSGISGE